MSKDKGQKNSKKSPADKTSGKVKEGSSYKNEGKTATAGSVIETGLPKTGVKTSSNPKVK